MSYLHYRQTSFASKYLQKLPFRNSSKPKLEKDDEPVNSDNLDKRCRKCKKECDENEEYKTLPCDSYHKFHTKCMPEAPTNECPECG